MIMQVYGVYTEFFIERDKPYKVETSEIYGHGKTKTKVRPASITSSQIPTESNMYANKSHKVEASQKVTLNVYKNLHFVSIEYNTFTSSHIHGQNESEVILKA